MDANVFDDSRDGWIIPDNYLTNPQTYHPMNRFIYALYLAHIAANFLSGKNKDCYFQALGTQFD